MIPKKIASIFEVLSDKNIDDNTITEGKLVCCASNEFEVRVIGTEKSNLLSKMYLLPEKEKTALKIRCKKCNKTISVFDSSCDGYEPSTSDCDCEMHLVSCKKCGSNNFSVSVKYEYPDIKELRELEIKEADNAFTWIWVTIKCNACGKEYKNFIDLETS